MAMKVNLENKINLLREKLNKFSDDVKLYNDPFRHLYIDKCIGISKDNITCVIKLMVDSPNDDCINIEFLVICNNGNYWARWSECETADIDSCFERITRLFVSLFDNKFKFVNKKFLGLFKLMYLVVEQNDGDEWFAISDKRFADINKSRFGI